MRQAFIGQSSGTANNAAAVTGLAFPALVEPGDWALLWWIYLNTATIVTDASGFSLESSVDASGSSRNRFYSRKCDGTEGGASIPLEVSALNRQCAGLVVYRGFHEIDAVDNFASLDEASTVSSHPTASVTPNNPDCAIITAVMERASTGTSSWTIAAPYADRVDAAVVGSGGTSLGIADDGLNVLRSPNVAVTPPNWVSGNAFASANVVTWSVALHPIEFRGWGVPL